MFQNRRHLTFIVLKKSKKNTTFAHEWKKQLINSLGVFYIHF